MTKRNIIYCLLTVVLGVYLLFALLASNAMADTAPCEGVDIEIKQNRMATFVTDSVIDFELGGLRTKLASKSVSQVSIQQIEDQLNALPIVEGATCYRTANDRLKIIVEPIIPVARVFDPTESYYINERGKRLKSELRYRMDLPIIIRENSDLPGAETAVPLAKHIESDRTLRELVTAIKIDRKGDIILVPSIAGHVINFGTPDVSQANDKFHRLFGFYRKVMPVKGWNYYDTISVKYAGQIVGITHPGAKYHPAQQFTDEELMEIEIIENNVEAISTDSITPLVPTI